MGIKIYIAMEVGQGASGLRKIFTKEEHAKDWCDEMNRGERLCTVEYTYEEVDISEQIGIPT